MLNHTASGLSHFLNKCIPGNELKRSLAISQKPKILWFFRRSRHEWQHEWEQGDRSGEFFYGMISLAQKYSVAFVEDPEKGCLYKIWRPIEQQLSKMMGMGFALNAVISHLTKLNRAETVISTVDTCGLPVGFLKRLGLVRSRLVYLSQGLSDRVNRHGKKNLVSRFYLWCAGGADTWVVLGEGDRQPLADCLGVKSDRVHVIPFGVDVEFWRPDSVVPQEELLSIGSDPARDYTTLLRATEYPLHIITRLEVPSAQVNQTVRTTNEHTSIELRSIYSSARMVVIPVKDVAQPSGQSATLQAMACEAAVIVTKNKGWWAEGILEDGKNCLLVPPNNPPALRKAIERLWNDKNLCRSLGIEARKTVVEKLSEQVMAQALDKILVTEETT